MTPPPVLLLTSVDPIERERAALLAEKVGIDASLAEMRRGLKRAGHNATDANRAALTAAQQRSQEVQARLAELRAEQTRRNIERATEETDERREWARRFVSKARKMLPRDVYNTIVEAASAEDSPAPKGEAKALVKYTPKQRAVVACDAAKGGDK